MATDENPIPALFMKVKRTNQEEHYLEGHWEKVREGDFTPASSNSQEEEPLLQSNFIDENLDINMEKLNKLMERIQEPMKIIAGNHRYYLPNNSTPCYACQDKSNLVKALV